MRPTGSVVLEQPQFVFPLAVSWDSSGMTVQGDKALVCQDLREPLSPNGPAWPRTPQKPGPGLGSGSLGSQPLALAEVPTVYLAHPARAVARDDLLTEESCKEKDDAE